MDTKPPPSHRRSRRELVVAGVAGVAGAAGAVIVTSGGGPGPRPKVRPRVPPAITSGAQVDIMILGRLLAFERHSVALYALATTTLTGAPLGTARTLLSHERQHAAAVEGTIRDLGGTPDPPSDFAEWSSIRQLARGGHSALGVLHTLEQQSVGAYLDALGQISTEDVRVTIAAVLATEAEHLAVVLGELGEPQLATPSVFGTGGAEPA